MNDLGWTLGWLALQVALISIPVIGLQALASRKGPASGAWAATLGLGMIVILGVLAIWPGGKDEPIETPASPRRDDRPALVAKAGPSPSTEVANFAGTSTDRGRTFDEIRLAWNRFERRAAGPVAIIRPWGKALAIASLAGSAVGLVRLAIGLWAVGLCRRRGQIVDDPTMIGLVEDLRQAMGCGRGVELREVADLATPATAGWLRPMLLLPGNWRGWDDSERRAVVAHELAHVVRGDYGSGLLARLAVVLNYYHPMVRWLAGRLQLEQELAADALGAKFAGGRLSYLRALSRLALEQDGRSRSWPARAFLPARGTLIRRIAMLKHDREAMTTGAKWSSSKRLAMALGLLALTIGVASWKAPANAADDKPAPAPVQAESQGVAHFVRPFEVNYISDPMIGVVAFRPAAITRRLNVGRIIPLIQSVLQPTFLAELRGDFGIDPTRPGWLKLEPEDIDSIVCGMAVDNIKSPDGKKDMHRLIFGSMTARTVAPFDWRKYLGQYQFEFVELKEGPHGFYQLKGPLQPFLGKSPCVYFPDDRTAVYDEEAVIRKHLARPSPVSPAYVQGADWERVSQDVFAYAIDNHDGKFARGYDMGRPDDKLFLPLFRGVDRWVIGLADTDSLTLRGEATTTDPQAAEAVARSIETLSKVGLASLQARFAAMNPALEGHAEVRLARLYQAILSKLKATPSGTTVTLSDGEFGTFADFAAMFKAGLAESSQIANPDPKAKQAKAGDKAEKR